MYRACIIVMNDKEYTGEKEELSSEKVIELLKEKKFDVIVHNIVPEIEEIIKRFVKKCCDEYKANLVILIGSEKLSNKVKSQVENRGDVSKVQYEIGDGKVRYISARNKTIIINIPEKTNEMNLKLNSIIECMKNLNEQ